MSYDLYAFDPVLAPANAGEFKSWFEGLQEADPDTYSVTAERCSPSLRAFVRSLQFWFVPLNPPRPMFMETFGVRPVVDCSFRPELVEMSFTWRSSPLAGAVVPRLASRRSVGLFDPQGGEAYFPSEKDRALELAFTI